MNKDTNIEYLRRAISILDTLQYNSSMSLAKIEASRDLIKEVIVRLGGDDEYTGNRPNNFGVL